MTKYVLRFTLNFNDCALTHEFDQRPTDEEAAELLERMPTSTLIESCGPPQLDHVWDVYEADE